MAEKTKENRCEDLAAPLTALNLSAADVPAGGGSVTYLLSPASQAANDAGAGAAVSQPSSPVWPSEFSMTFTETFTYPVLGTKTTTGTYYYGAKYGAERVDRANGHYDRYCGGNGLKIAQNTPCNQYIARRDFFLQRTFL